VSFVDTHTFQLEAPLPDRACWEREVDARATRHPAYERYGTLERASLRRNGTYRCSSGLVLDVLGDRRACAVLGEANAASRAELFTQIAADGFSADAAFVLYRYSRNARAPWPDAPAGTSGPITELRDGPHEVAAYASPRIAEAVLDTCAALGWGGP
jgi:hypothetical protein